MRVVLIVEAGPHLGAEFVFEEHDKFIVGRSDRAQFRLPLKDKTLSRIHFMVEVNPPRCRVIDLHSTNRTKVNGQVIEVADLEHGDLITAGKSVLRVAIVEGGGAAESVTETVPVRRATPGAEPGKSTGASQSSGTETAVQEPSGGRQSAGRHGTACLACAAPLADLDGASGREESWSLCAGCLDKAREEPQPVPNHLVVRELGRGGMGIVYLAVRVGDGRPVALKTIKPEVAGAEAVIGRFLREASILRELDHPNIVAFREMGEAEGQLYFTMDYVEGVDASRLQKERGAALPIGRAVGWVCQLLEALAYAHAKGFVHRDIKPANLLVTSEGGREVIKVADFGLARAYQTSRLSGLTMKDDLGGTLPFMSPEQIISLREAQPPVDFYSAGATLYKLLTDRYPYDLPRRLDRQIVTVLNESPIPVLSRRVDLPAALARVIDQSLAREPTDRFADADEMRRALLPFAQ